MSTNLTSANLIQVSKPRPELDRHRTVDVITDPNKKPNDLSTVEQYSLHKVAGTQEPVIEKRQNVFARFWNWFKGIFGFGNRLGSVDLPKVSGTKVWVHQPHAMTSHERPQVHIQEGLVDSTFVKNNVDKYVFVFGSNLGRIPGRFGQSSILRQVKNLYPESIVELPVTQLPVTSFDPADVAKLSLPEDNDLDLARNIETISSALDEAIDKAKSQNKTILLLKGGYGTGFSRMHLYAPKTFAAMNRLFEEKLGVSQVIDLVTGQFSVEYVEDLAKQGGNIKTADTKDQTQSKSLTSNLWSSGWSMVDHGKD